jgi:uncharacterized membrane protein YuzA (DUF378 family)
MTAVSNMKNLAVIPFYIAGALFFLGLTVLSFIAADSFHGHFFQARTLALVHIAALGWGTMLIFGAAYQLIPVIFERPLYSPRLAFASFVSLVIGSFCLVTAFWNSHTGWPMLAGGSLVVVATLLYIINLFLTADYKAVSIAKCFVFSSACWLLATTVAGLMLAINLAFPFIEGNHLELLKIHAHLGLAGWFLQLISGVSSILVPMFLFGKSAKTNLLRAAFILQHVGLLGFTADHYFFGPSARAPLYILIVLAGILCWLGFLADVYRRRVKKKVDLQMRFTGASLAALLLAVATLLPIFWFSSHAWNSLYGTLLFFGWISGLIFGKTFKTLPFIVWNHHYKDVHGQKNIPLPKDLYNEKLIRLQFWLFLSASLSLAAGILSDTLWISKAAMLVWTLVALLYLLNIGNVLAHKKVRL